MALPKVALHIGLIGAAVGLFAFAANWRVSPDVELVAEISGVDLTVGREDPIEPLLPALSASQVSFDLVKRIDVPSERLPREVRDPGPVTSLKTSLVDADYGAIGFRPSATSQSITVQPVRLQADGRLRLGFGTASGRRISILLTKLSEPVSIVAPGHLVIDAVPPSTLAWRSGSGPQLTLAVTPEPQAIPILSSPSVLLLVEGIGGSVLPSLLSDRARFSRVAFQSPDAVDGLQRSTLVKGLSIKFPSLPDFRPLLGTTSDLLVLQSAGQLRFSRVALADNGLMVTLIGSANAVMHGSVDLRPTLLDVVWSNKMLVLLATALFAVVGALVKILDLRERLLKVLAKPKEYRD